MSAIDGWDICRVAFSDLDAERFIGLQFDWYGDDAGGPPVELHSPYGFLSRPHDPDVSPDGELTEGCQALRAYEGSRGHAWLSFDPRGIKYLPSVNKGGSLFFGGKLKNPGWLRFDGSTNSLQLYVPYGIVNDVASKSMSMRFDVDAEAIEIVHGSGMRIVMHDGTVTIRSASGSTSVFIDDDKITLNGNTKVAGGLDVGGGTSIPVALATPLLTYLEAIEQATKVGLGTIPTVGGATASAFQAAMLAVAAAKAAIAATLTKAL